MTTTPRTWAAPRPYAADRHYVYFAWGRRRRWWRRDPGSARARITRRTIGDRTSIPPVFAAPSWPEPLDLLYVGETVGFDRRRAQHEEDPARWWTPLVVEWVAVEVRGSTLGEAIESAWIEGASGGQVPLYNVKGSRGRYARSVKARHRRDARVREWRYRSWAVAVWVVPVMLAVALASLTLMS